MKEESILSIDALYPDINKVACDFYKKILDCSAKQSDVGIFLVAPAYETTLALVQAIASRRNLCGIILKNSTRKRNPRVYAMLQEAGYPVLNITKADMLKADGRTIDKIKMATLSCKQFVLMDHGGYFALNKKILEKIPPDKLIGITEYTLNGEQRYIAQGITDRPIISVGQSILKVPSDEAASDAIVLASDMYVRNGGILLSSGMNNIGIIGLGRLGGRIRQKLTKMDAPNIKAFDIDEEKMAGLSKKQTPKNKEALLRKSNILFCATGNKALTAEEFSLLENNTIIFNVTSPDDELGLDKLMKDGVLKPLPHRIKTDTYLYEVVATGKVIILPFNGESPNTTLQFGMADPVIHLPCAAHIVAAEDLAKPTRMNLKKGVIQITKRNELFIQYRWDQFYAKNKLDNSSTTRACKKTQPHTTTVRIPEKNAVDGKVKKVVRKNNIASPPCTL